MSEPDDHQLLAEFARKNSEAAFAALVQRHINLVYSVALRRIGNPHAAEEITQAVFIILSRKAGKLSPRIALSGWLYQTARLTAANFLRGEIRRQKREQEAYMQSTLNEPAPDVWPQIAPLLDDALGQLGERDRNAIVLRFFENRSLGEVGAALGASEDAAKMRVNRALEKLRKIFTKRGVTLSATLIAGVVSANSVQAAPAGLTVTVTAAAAKGAAVGSSTLTLVKGALKIMAWTKAKTVMVVIGVMCVTATAPLVLKPHQSAGEAPVGWRQRFEAVYKLKDGEVLKHIAPPFIPERAEFYHSDKSLSLQAKYAFNPPESFIFEQQGRNLRFWMATFSAADMPLSSVSRELFQIGRQDLEGPKELLNLNLDGDWSFRADTSREKLVAALETITQEETGRHIRMEPRNVERIVLVVRGSLTPDFLNHPTADQRHLPALDVYARVKDGKDGLGSGKTQEFLKWTADWLALRIVDETGPKTQNLRFDWRIHSDSEERNMGNRREETTAAVLKNIETQTGLSFTKEKRLVEVWFVTEKPQ